MSTRYGWTLTFQVKVVGKTVFLYNEDQVVQLNITKPTSTSTTTSVNVEFLDGSTTIVGIYASGKVSYKMGGQTLSNKYADFVPTTALGTASNAETAFEDTSSSSTGGTTGSNFNLTTGADSGTSFTGTTGDDTYNGVIGTNGLSASPNQRKALFSSERFLFLAEMLQKYQVPMVVTDIDVECVRDPRELLSRIGEADLGYTHFRNTIEAWERYAATALIFRPTTAAIAFCRRMADLLVSALDSHAQPWFIDQIALFRLIEELPTGVRTCFLENILTESNPPAPSGYFRILHGSWEGEG